VELTDGWTMREALGETWRWHVGQSVAAGNSVSAAVEGARSVPGWIPARVPGSVVEDLARAGEVPDPRAGLNSRAAEWVAERSWVHRRRVDVPPRRPGERVVLEFDGVDPAATIWWDGELIGETAGPYRPLRIDLDSGVGVGGPGSRTLPGPHTLAVVVQPAPASEPQVGRTERVRRLAPRMGYGWDFCPPLRHQGIWKAVRMVVSELTVDSVVVHSRLGDGSASGEVDVTACVSGGTGARYEVTVGRDGRVVARESGVVTASARAEPGSAAAALHVRLTVDSPQLWWPNGLGAHPLYTVTIRVARDAGPAGSEADAATAGVPIVVEREVGFRHLSFETNPGSPSGALAYTAVVNGQPVSLVGWNWVPGDALYGALPIERVRHLLDLAERSGARLLRVWGGGLIETEAFYAECDRRGLLVWQEFSQSSSGMQSAPATDEAFLAQARSDARVVVPTLVHHPSLAIWGGGNELDEDGIPLDEARSPVLAVLRDTVAELDPGRHWLPTSPTGPEFHNRLDRILAAPEGQHDVHGPWEHQGLVEHHTLYNAGTSLAHTEFGVEGMTNLRSLERLIPGGEQWPPDRSNPYYRHLGEWWNNAELVQRTFGGGIDNVAEMIRASQFLQATGLQYAVEADRRRSPRCSMVLPWQLNESYPNAWCTSAVDFLGGTKSAFDAVTRAFQPERATIRVACTAWAGRSRLLAEAWVWAERGELATSRVTLKALDLYGNVIAETACSPGPVSAPQRAVTLEVDPSAFAPGSDLFVWEVVWTGADGRTIDRDLMVGTLAEDLGSLRRLDAEVDVRVRAAGDAWTVSISHLSGPVAVGVRLVDARAADEPGWVICANDPRPLLPGEQREIEVMWTGGDPGARCLALDGWHRRSNGRLVPADAS
jgi:beta-mannosidase